MTTPSHSILFSGETLFNALNTLFTTDPEICEIGLLLSPEPHDETGPLFTVLQEGQAKAEQCTTPFVLQDHRLGIAFWCLPRLYMHAMEQLEKHGTIASTGNDSEDIGDRREGALQATRAVLLINADCNTAWNVRKRMLEEGRGGGGGGAEYEEREMRFVDLVATKHPKSVELWSHRRWLLHRMFQQKDLTARDAHAIVKREADFCERMATIYPRNYYAWTHRQIALELFCRRGNGGEEDDARGVVVEFIEDQLERIRSFVRRNVSDHSAMHHTQRLLLEWKSYALAHGRAIDARLLNRFLRNVLHEIHFCQFLIVMFPGHEALWYHRRFLVSHFMECILEMDKRRVVDEVNMEELLYVEDRVESFEPDDEEDSSLSAASVAFHDFMRQVAFAMETDYHCDAGDELYSHRTPAVYNEILFSENCATDRDMADYSDQRRLAISYEIWLCHFSVKMIDSMLHAAGKPKFDLLSRVVDVSSRSILVQRAQECCAIAAKESRVHSAMWKQVLSAVLQPLEKCEEQSNIQ